MGAFTRKGGSGVHLGLQGSPLSAPCCQPESSLVYSGLLVGPDPKTAASHSSQRSLSRQAMSLPLAQGLARLGQQARRERSSHPAKQLMCRRRLGGGPSQHDREALNL